MSAILYVGVLILLSYEVKAYNTEDVDQIKQISKSILFAIDAECGYPALYSLRKFVEDTHERQKYIYSDIDDYLHVYLEATTHEFRHCVKDVLESIYEEIEGCYTENEGDGKLYCEWRNRVILLRSYCDNAMIFDSRPKRGRTCTTYFITPGSLKHGTRVEHQERVSE